MIADADMRAFAALLTLHPERQSIGEHLLALLLETELPDSVLRRQILCLAACALSGESTADTLDLAVAHGGACCINRRAALFSPRAIGVRLRRT